MKLSEEVLMAYVDGELDGAARDEVAGALATDPEAARWVHAQQALRRKLRADFEPVLSEPVPQRLRALVTNATSAGSAQVLAFPARNAPRRPWLRWGALAASFALGALVWQFTGRLDSTAPFTQQHGELLAAGNLARALDEQLAGGQPSSAAVQIGVSFLSRQGAYCRTFSVRGAANTSGLACHGTEGWAVQVLARAPAAQPQGPYRQAASELPPVVAQAVSETIAGEALDAAGEARARAAHWQAPR